MSLEAAACAAAAADLGYPGFAEIITERQLSAAAAGYLLKRYGVGKDGGLTIAIVVLSASTARHRAHPNEWNGDVERALALAALNNKAESTKPPDVPPRLSWPIGRRLLLRL
jgi:hypothetical protein